MQKKIQMLKIILDTPIFEDNMSFSIEHCWVIKFKQDGKWYQATVIQDFHASPLFTFYIAVVHALDMDEYVGKAFYPGEFFENREDVTKQFKAYIIKKCGGLSQPELAESFTKNVDKEVLMFVEHVFQDNQLEITEWDMDRIFVKRHDEEYMIRTWNITNEIIEWTLYKLGHGSHTKNIKAGIFYR